MDKLYIWPNGTTLSDNGNEYWELPGYLSDDFFVIDTEKLPLKQAKELIFQHFAFKGKDGEFKTEQAENVFEEVKGYYPENPEWEQWVLSNVGKGQGIFKWWDLPEFMRKRFTVGGDEDHLVIFNDDSEMGAIDQRGWLDFGRCPDVNEKDVRIGKQAYTVYILAH